METQYGYNFVFVPSISRNHCILVLIELYHLQATYQSLSINDLQDIFHTFDFNSNGYAMIENEIVSFENKEYTISGSGSSTKTVSVKNGLSYKG